MPLTPNLTTVTVGGQFVDVAGNAIAGQVKFTPRAILADPAADQVIVPRTVTVDLDSTGAFTVVIPATDDTSLSPVNWTYKVEEAFSGGRTYDIVVPSTPTLQNLADMSPAVAVGSSEASTYVLLSVFYALEARVTAIEGVTSLVQSSATTVATAAAAATAAQVLLAQTVDSRNIHPFLYLGI